MNVVNRPIQVEDKAQWLALWKGYNDFYGSNLADEITEHTWQRILSPESPIFGRVAVVDGRVAAFALCVLHGV